MGDRLRLLEAAAGFPLLLEGVLGAAKGGSAAVVKIDDRDVPGPSLASLSGGIGSISSLLLFVEFLSIS